jgi:hypothetical protein
LVTFPEIHRNWWKFPEIALNWNHPEKPGTKGKQEMATKKVELTENQILAILTAIQIHEDSYAGFPKDELRDWGVNRELLALRQVVAKLDATAERLEA